MSMFHLLLNTTVIKKEDSHAFEPANKGMIFPLSEGISIEKHFKFFLSQTSEVISFL
jgi:hypothetical protein